MSMQTYFAFGLFFLIVFIGPPVGAADDGSGHPYGARGSPSAAPRSPGTAPAPEHPSATAQKAADKVQAATQAYMQAKTILMISSDNPAGNDSKKAVVAANKAAAAYNKLVQAREAAGAIGVKEAATAAAKADAAQAMKASKEAAAKATTPSTTIGAGGLDWKTLEERPPGSGMWYKKAVAMQVPAAKSVAAIKNADAKQKAAQVKATAEEKVQLAKLAAEKAKAAAKEAVAKAEAEKKKAIADQGLPVKDPSQMTMAEIISKIVASHADGNNAIHSGQEIPIGAGGGAVKITQPALGFGAGGPAPPALPTYDMTKYKLPQPSPPLDAKAEAQYQANRAEYIRVNGFLPPTGHPPALAAQTAVYGVGTDHVIVTKVGSVNAVAAQAQAINQAYANRAAAAAKSHALEVARQVVAAKKARADNPVAASQYDAGKTQYEAAKAEYIRVNGSLAPAGRVGIDVIWRPNPAFENQSQFDVPAQ